MTTPEPTRIAAVDIGSNTTRLMVADVTRLPDGTLLHEPIVRTSQITRLAQGVDARGILLPDALARTRNALVDFRARARELHAVYVLASATSAVRDADNGEAFLGEIEYSYGFDTVLLSGSDEALTTWRGVTSDPATAAAAAAATGLLLDIGGGSTEIMLTDHGTLTDHDSLQLGSVRLTEQELAAADPPTQHQLESARDVATAMIAGRFPTPKTPDLAIGVAGSVTTVAAIVQKLATYDPERIHRSTITRAQVADTLDPLGGMCLSDREHVVGLEPRRAAVIVAGITILLATLDHFDIDTMLVSERDILDGVALRAGAHAITAGISGLSEPFGRTPC